MGTSRVGTRHGGNQISTDEIPDLSPDFWGQLNDILQVLYVRYIRMTITIWGGSDGRGLRFLPDHQGGETG